VERKTGDIFSHETHSGGVNCWKTRGSDGEVSSFHQEKMSGKGRGVRNWRGGRLLTPRVKQKPQAKCWSDLKMVLASELETEECESGVGHYGAICGEGGWWLKDRGEGGDY